MAAQVIAHNPETTPSDPALLKLRMGRRADGKILAICYAEYLGLPPGIPPASILEIGKAIDADPEKEVTQHVLDAEVCDTIEAAQAWFEKVRREQPWIARS